MPVRPLLGYFLISACLIALIATGLNMELKAPDWASWVQAVGSMVAIGVAFAVANRQHLGDRRLDGERRHADERIRFQVVRALLVRTHVVVDAIETVLRESTFGLASDEHLFQLDDCEEAIKALVLFDLPHEDLVLYCAGLPRTIHQLRESLASQRTYFESADQFPDAAVEKLNQRLRDLISITAESATFCDTEIAKRTPPATR